jgi:D-3-phosphoglycerate dehydrogenase
VAQFRVVVTDDRYGSYLEEEEVLKEIGARLEVHNLTTEEETVRVLKDADAALVNLHPMGAGVIRRLEKCRVLSRYGVGYDNVDVEAATAKGIWVARVPDYGFEDVSDQALALLLGCVRKIAFKDRRVRAGGWNLIKEQPCFRVRGKVLGFIGFGGIARTLHRKLQGFGLAGVLVVDPYVDPAAVRQAGAEPVDLDTLLRRADFISLHATLTAETRHLIDGRAIERMKPTAILVNTSRGPLVDEQALAGALAAGRLAGAGLDVFEKEPLPAESPLRGLDNVILSDHAGWYSEESIVELKTKAARNVLEVLKGGKPVYPVNQV